MLDQHLNIFKKLKKEKPCLIPRFFILIALLLTQPVYSQDTGTLVAEEIESAGNNELNPAEPIEERAVEQASSGSNTTENNSQREERSNRNFDVFQPSEDISEDLAVPFPVDI